MITHNLAQGAASVVKALDCHIIVNLRSGPAESLAASGKTTGQDCYRVPDTSHFTRGHVGAFVTTECGPLKACSERSIAAHRRHDGVLPPKQGHLNDNNFITRMLYKEPPIFNSMVFFIFHIHLSYFLIHRNNMTIIITGLLITLFHYDILYVFYCFTLCTSCILSAFIKPILYCVVLCLFGLHREYGSACSDHRRTSESRR